MEFLIKDVPDSTAHMILELDEGDKVCSNTILCTCTVTLGT